MLDLWGPMGTYGGPMGTYGGPMGNLCGPMGDVLGTYGESMGDLWGPMKNLWDLWECCSCGGGPMGLIYGASGPCSFSRFMYSIAVKDLW